MIKNDLCISCGICEAVCPKKAIEMKKINYDYLPIANLEACSKCGLCNIVCPQKQKYDYNEQKPFEQHVLGNYKSILSVKSKDKELLIQCASGGVITTLIKACLKDDLYDCTFLLDDYSYNIQLQMKYFDKKSNFSKTPKSRYLTVSHKNTCEFMEKNPDKKIIIVGTGCAINGILKFIEIKNLKRENYLFLGLFCEKTMNYAIVKYFQEMSKKIKRKIPQNIYFKSKYAGGWPGNVRFEYEDKTYIDLDKKRRMEVKDYFVPECCLYCLNKVNKNADISTGDNYIKTLEDIEGKSSVLIRTELGNSVFTRYKELFEVLPENEKTFLDSVKLEYKRDNLEFAKIKGLISGTPEQGFPEKYKTIMQKRAKGNSKNLYKAVTKDLSGRNSKKTFISQIKKFIFRLN